MQAHAKQLFGCDRVFRHQHVGSRLELRRRSAAVRRPPFAAKQLGIAAQRSALHKDPPQRVAADLHKIPQSRGHRAVASARAFPARWFGFPKKRRRPSRSVNFDSGWSSWNGTAPRPSRTIRRPAAWASGSTLGRGGTLVGIVYRTAATRRVGIVATMAIGTALIAIVVAAASISAMMPDCNAVKRTQLLHSTSFYAAQCVS